MKHLDRILQGNADWVARMRAQNPQFFSELAKGQTPNFLFIGCSDSRVPANEITGTGPGEMFVHRNIANQVFPSDLNLLSVLHYAVDVLDVPGIIVCGHYGCGGVKAASGKATGGPVDHWLGQIRELEFLYRKHLAELEPDAFHRAMVQLNVLRAVRNLASTPIVQAAWTRGKRPLLHGLVYDLHDGVLDPLIVGMDSWDHAEDALHNLWSALEHHRDQPYVRP